MLRGKIICPRCESEPGDNAVSGCSACVPRDHRDYCVKVGSVLVDITADVRAMIAEEVTRAVIAKEQTINELLARHASVIERYKQIERIVLAGGAGMPTG